MNASMKRMVCLVLALMMSCSLVACGTSSTTTGNEMTSTSGEGNGNSMSEEEMENYYQLGQEALMDNDFETASENFNKIQDYKDSSKYYAYSMGMQSTGKPMKLYDVYQYFLEAGDVENSESTAEYLKNAIDELTGTWQKGFSGHTYYYIDDNSHAAVEFELTDDPYYMYDIYVQLYFYGIDQNVMFNAFYLGVGTNTKDVYTNLEFDEDDNLYSFKNSSDDHDLFIKLNEELYNKMEHTQTVQEEADTVGKHIADYRVIPAEEAIELLYGTWTVNEWTEESTYTFNEDGTYTVNNSYGESQDEWRIENGLMYIMKRDDGGWYRTLELRDYKNGGYIFLEYNQLNNGYNYYTAVPENQLSRNLPYRNASYEYYDELWSMPTADSALDGVSYLKTEKQYQGTQTTNVYYYELPQDKEEAKAAFAEYQDILAQYFDTELTETEMLTVSINGVLKSTVMAGKDNDIGYYMVIALNPVD